MNISLVDYLICLHNCIDRENGSSEGTEMNMGHSDADKELKRKQQAEASSETNHPEKLQKDGQGNKQPSSGKKSARKQSKRDRIDYNVLVPPKSHSKKRGG